MSFEYGIGSMGNAEGSLLGFHKLRDGVLEGSKQEVLKRISSNPVPDEEELSAGTYREFLEPQCRAAIFKIRRKGHETYSSGFGGPGDDIQVLDGVFSLEQPESGLLTKQGYTVKRNQITFQFKIADLDEMTKKWDKLAELLPDLGAPANPLCSNINDFYQAQMKTYTGLYLVQKPNGDTVLSVRPDFS